MIEKNAAKEDIEKINEEIKETEADLKNIESLTDEEKNSLLTESMIIFIF